LQQLEETLKSERQEEEDRNICDQRGRPKGLAEHKMNTLLLAKAEMLYHLEVLERAGPPFALWSLLLGRSREQNVNWDVNFSG
jgi:hypothetical protein